MPSSKLFILGFYKGEKELKRKEIDKRLWFHLFGVCYYFFKLNKKKVIRKLNINNP